MQKEKTPIQSRDSHDPQKLIKTSTRLIQKLRKDDKNIRTLFENLFKGVVLRKSNSSQEVRNNGNALDEFLKDALGNYYQENINIDKDKDLELPIQFLLKQINANDVNPQVKILVISWISFILGSQSINSIRYLPEIILQLMNLLPDPVREVHQCAAQCLIRMLKGFDTRYEEFSYENPELMQSIANIIIERSTIDEKSIRSFALEWLYILLNKYKDIISKYINEKKDKGGIKEEMLIQEKNRKIMIKAGILSKTDSSVYISPSILIKTIPFSSFPLILRVLLIKEKSDDNIINKCNSTFQSIVLLSPKEMLGNNLIPMTDVLSIHLDSNDKDVKIVSIFDWILKMFDRYNVQMFNNTEEFIERIINILPNNKERIFQNLLSILCKFAKFDLSYSKIILQYTINKLSQCPSIIKVRGIRLLQILSSAIPVTLLYEISADYLLQNKVDMSIMIIDILDIFLLSKNECEPVRLKLKRYNSPQRTKSDEVFFEKIFALWSFKPISALMLSLIAEYFELSFALVRKISQMELEQEDYLQLTQVVQLIESSMCLRLRLKLLDPLKNYLFVKTLFGIILLLPQGEAFNNLSMRMRNLKTTLVLYKVDKKQIKQLTSPLGDIEISENKRKEIDNLIKIFSNKQYSKR